MKFEALDAGALRPKPPEDPAVTEFKQGRRARRIARDKEQLAADVSLPDAFLAKIVGKAFHSEDHFRFEVSRDARIDIDHSRTKIVQWAQGLADVGEFDFRIFNETNSTINPLLPKSVRCDFTPSLQVEIKGDQGSVFCRIEFPGINTHYNLNDDSTVKVTNLKLDSEWSVAVQSPGFNENVASVCADDIRIAQTPKGYEPVAAWEEMFAALKGSVFGAICAQSSSGVDSMRSVMSQRAQLDPIIALPKRTRVVDCGKIECALSQAGLRGGQYNYLTRMLDGFRGRDFEKWKTWAWEAANMGGYIETLKVPKANGHAGPLLFVDKYDLVVGIAPARTKFQTYRDGPESERLVACASQYELVNFLKGFRAGFGVGAFR